MYDAFDERIPRKFLFSEINFVHKLLRGKGCFGKSVVESLRSAPVCLVVKATVLFVPPTSVRNDVSPRDQ
jgi:hypothetical protein